MDTDLQHLLSTSESKTSSSHSYHLEPSVPPPSTVEEVNQVYDIEQCRRLVQKYRYHDSSSGALVPTVRMKAVDLAALWPDQAQRAAMLDGLRQLQVSTPGAVSPMTPKQVLELCICVARKCLLPPDATPLLQVPSTVAMGEVNGNDMRLHTKTLENHNMSRWTSRLRRVWRRLMRCFGRHTSIPLGMMSILTHQTLTSVDPTYGLCMTAALCDEEVYLDLQLPMGFWWSSRYAAAHSRLRTKRSAMMTHLLTLSGLRSPVVPRQGERGGTEEVVSTPDTFIGERFTGLLVSPSSGTLPATFQCNYSGWPRKDLVMFRVHEEMPGTDKNDGNPL